MKFNLIKVRTVVLALLSGIVLFSLGYALGFKTQNPEEDYKVIISRSLPENKKELNFQLFWDVWDSLENSYFDKSKLKDSDMVWGAIKGMVGAVGDPYTVFLTPDEQRVMQEDLSGNFEGVGIQIGYKGTQLAVVAPLPGSPAEEAGIEAGDLIVGIKDEEKDIERGTVGMSLPEAVQIIRGSAGSVVTLSLLREGTEEPVTVDVKRRAINVPSVTLEFVGENENIAHLKVLKFGGETLEEWDSSVLEILKKQNLAGIIVDVRNNPGGYLQGAVELGSEFLEEGELVVTEEYANGDRTEFTAERAGRLTRDNIVVLVNGGSASASEILAGALKDNKDVKLVGEKTFGKGTVQEARQLGEVGLHVTVAKWLTPSGSWVNEVGLTPDVEIEDNTDTTEDEQVSKAIEVLSGLSLSSGF